jgi:hypothetical protein
VTVQADGSTVVTKAGAQLATSTSVFIGNRLIIAVPAAAAVRPDWTVQAVIKIAGDQPLRPAGGQRGLPAELVYATQPAIVGVLTGDNAGGPEPLAAQAIVNSTQPGVQPTDPVDVPAGGRPTTLRLERSGNGVVAVVTLDGPPRAPRSSTTVNGQPVQQETLRLSIAPAVQDGLGVARMVIEYFYPTSTCGQPKCPAGTLATVLIAGNDVGTVPVTVSGKEVRFDFGHFAPSKQSQTVPSIPTGQQFIGTTKNTFTLDAQDLDMVPLGTTAPTWSGQTTIALDGTSISITSPAGETAKGVVNPSTGYFFASDTDEMWSGFLGKQGWYERIVPMAHTTAAVFGPVHTDLSLGDVAYQVLDYYWIQKATLQGMMWVPIPDPIMGGFMFLPSFETSQLTAEAHQLDEAVAAWLAFQATSNVPPGGDTWSWIFPPGYDPVVVPVPAPIPFPFAKSLPKLARTGGQWEIAAGIQLAGAHGNIVFAFGPYVPASSLLGTAKRPASSHANTSSTKPKK